MTTPATPRQPWDDRRLAAAFAARASAITTPTNLVDTTVERVRTADRPEPAWRRWLPAAAVIVLAVGVIASGLALSDGVVGRRLFRPGPTADLKTLDTGEFAFEYPASWLAYDASASFSGGSAIAVLGTLPVEPRCGNERHVDINCVSEQRLEPGRIRVLVLGGTYRGGTIQDRPDIEGGTTTRTSVAGMPAILHESDGRADSYYREDKSLIWEIARPGTDGTNVVRLEALLTEPGVALGRQQLESLVDSFRFTNGPDPSTTPTPEPTPTVTPPRLADLRVMSVEELIAAAESPTPEEVIVSGWLGQLGVVRSCPLVLDPHPLLPICEELDLYLVDREAYAGPSFEPTAPHIVPILRADAHRQVDISQGVAVEVQAIGHLLDHRWTTCPAELQDDCKARFVIDRLVPAGQPLDGDLPSPWAIPADFPTEQSEEPVEVLSSVVGGLTVVSIGNADATGVRSIEPLVEEINEGQGAWVIRALVGGDPTPVARTFLVGHIGWWTIFEVTEEGLVDRTQRVEGAPTAMPTDDPGVSWPPKGVLDVPMPELPTGRDPTAGVVDRTGLLVEARAAGESDPGRPVRGLQQGEMAIVQAAPDSVIAYWDGTLCDDRLVLTLHGHGPGEPPNRIELRGESANRCRLALVRYGMVLRFSQAVDAAAIQSWDRVGTRFEAFPPVDATVVFLAKDGGFELPKVRAALVDLSGRVTGVRAPRPDEPRLIDRGGGRSAFLIPDPTVPDRYQLVWTGGRCDGDTVVTIDDELRTVMVEATQVGGCDAIGVERRLIIDVDGAIDPAAVEVRYTETRAGAS